MPGRHAEREADDGRGDQRHEQRRDGAARRGRFDEDGAEHAEQQHPAHQPPERTDEVGDDRECDRGGERDPKHGEGRLLDVEPPDLVEVRPAPDREPGRDQRDPNPERYGRGGLEEDEGPPPGERRDDERDGEQGEAVVGELPARLEPARKRPEQPDQRALEGRRRVHRDQQPETGERGDQEEDVRRPAEPALTARGGEHPGGNVSARGARRRHRASLRGAAAAGVSDTKSDTETPHTLPPMAEASAPEERSWGTRLARWPLGIVQNLVRAVPAAIDGFFRDRLTQHAAGIAYRVLFSLVPLTIVLVSIVGIALHDEARKQDVIDEIVSHLPFTEEGSTTVEEAITRLASPTSAFGLVSLLVFFWASSGMMGAVRTGLEAALRVEPDRRRPAARAKLVDLILVAGAGALLLAMVAVTVAAQVVTRLVGGAAGAVGLEGGVFAEVLRIAVPLVVATVVVMLLYRFVPARRLRFGDAVVGGIVTGLLLLAISAASAFVYDQVAGLSVVYGSITALLVFLYSVYLYASALLFGAELAAAWSAPPDAGPSEPIRDQARRAVLGLLVRQKPPDPPPR